MRRWRVAGGLLAVVLSSSVLSCGDDGGDGMAGAPAPPPALGERCTSACATSGTVCVRQGGFAGICTTSCSGDAACQLLEPGARCFGTSCALRCEAAGDCPDGTTCTPVQGRMACVPD